MKNIVKFLLTAILLSTVVTWSATVSTEYTKYKVNDAVWVNIDVLPNDLPEDWIGIFKVGDANALNKIQDWSWVKNPDFDRNWYKLSAKNLKDGNYEVRYFEDGTFDNVHGTYQFNVTDGILTCDIKLKIPPYYSLAEKINVTLNDCEQNLRNKNSWIGIFKLGADNERKNLLDWHYINKANTITFANALKKGKYEVRLFKDGSYKNLIKSSKFSVGDTTPDIITRKTIYPANEDALIGLKNVVPANKKTAWIGIYKAGDTSGVHNRIAKILVKDKTSSDGLVDWYKFSGLQGGNYEARYFEDATFNVIDSVKFSVRQAKVVELGTWKKNYSNAIKNIWISLRNGRKDGGPKGKDWIGLYKVGAPSDYANLLNWKYTIDADEIDGSIAWFRLAMLSQGKYEARYFHDDNYIVKKEVKFYVDSPYGHGGQKNVAVIDKGNGFALYHPTNWAENATPLVFFLPGLGQRDATAYKTLLNFMVSYGYSVIFIPDVGTYSSRLSTIDNIINTYQYKLDTTKIGIIGDLDGGGLAFKLLEDMSAKGYGARTGNMNHRFVLSMDGSYASFMDKSNMQALKDTNVVLMQFGHNGNSTDPRIVLGNYYLLTGKNIDKNYIVLQDEPYHTYPKRTDIDKMQGMLKPLDALMKYTFKEKIPAHHEMALEGKGKVDPYMNVYQKVLTSPSYRFTCTDANVAHIGANLITASDILNCGDPRTLMPNIDF